MMRVGGGGPDLLNAVRFDIVRYTRGKGIDVGRGEYKAFPHFVGVREKGDETIKAPVTADFLVDTFANFADFVEGSLDFVFCWGLTGEEAETVKAQSLSMLKDGGHYLDVVDRDGLVDRRVYSKIDGELQWVAPDVTETFTDPPPPKRALVVRYGAIGDMLQVASLLPELKRQGYHVTLNSHPTGGEVLRHDPHIDEFIVQDPDQVPNQELVPYWNHITPQYDRVINLCESVEGTLLTYPGRANHRWPDAVRRKVCNVNYLEFMADIAELPLVPEYHFYPTEEEKDKARATTARIADAMNPDFSVLQLLPKWQDPFIVMWALAGSSVHKFYPHQDAVIAQILLQIPNAHVIFVGDQVAQYLEGGWQNEKRVTCLSGKLPIRDSLALAQQCNLVIGPETGILNAVAFESMAKIVLLSHSTNENLTRDWVNTDGIHSDTTPCYPCHRLHYNHEFCPRDEKTAAAYCQRDIPPSVVWNAVQRAYTGWGTVRKLIHP